jgi:branched-chain amino acid transport system permease protein
MVQWESLTAGTTGISGIPALALGGLQFDSYHPRNMYYLVAVAVLVCMAIAGNIVDSRVGRAMRAVHGSEVAAGTSGVDVGRYKLQVFVLSGALAGLAGSLLAQHLGYINPDSFELGYSINLLVMVVLGGMASIWGAIFGVAAVTLIGENLRSLLEYSTIVFGLVLMVVMIFLPSGLWRGGALIVERVTGWGRGRARQEVDVR